MVSCDTLLLLLWKYGCTLLPSLRVVMKDSCDAGADNGCGYNECSCCCVSGGGIRVAGCAGGCLWVWIWFWVGFGFGLGFWVFGREVAECRRCDICVVGVAG